MAEKVWKIMWYVSLFIIDTAVIVLAGNTIISKIVGKGIPDMWIRVSGIVLMIALAFFAFSSVKKSL